MPAFTNAIAEAEGTDETLYPQKLAAWYHTNDLGSASVPAWSDPSYDAQSWSDMKLPNYFQHAGLPDFNGIVWFRKEIYLPDTWTGKAAVLHDVPGSVLKPGRNVIVVRVLDTGGLGGLYGKAANMKLQLADEPLKAPVDLSGEWQFHATTALTNLPPVPVNPASNPNVVTVLYNGMIEPLEPFPFRGSFGIRANPMTARPGGPINIAPCFRY